MPTPPRENQLFVSERPVRSDYGRADNRREREYARRRKITVCVAVLLVCGLIYVLWPHHSGDPSDIPLIRAEGAYKQRPADPGGIEIPHQDVRLYDQLEGKNASAVAVEHLLPPPETPIETSHSDRVHVEVPVTAPALPANAASPPGGLPAAPAVTSISAPAALEAPSVKAETKADTSAAKATTKPLPNADISAAVHSQPVPLVTPAAPSVPVAPVVTNAVPASIEQLIKKTALPAPAASPGAFFVQLASSSEENKAQNLLQELQQKFAGDLSGISLHLVRADLGSRGVFYRIQSSGLSEDAANRVCSALKLKQAGCILVRK